MLAIAAAVPVVLACALFLAGVRATRMAGWSLGAGIAVAVAFFPTPVSELLAAAARFGPTILEVLLILYGGVLLSRIATETGAMSRISDWLRGSAPNVAAGTALVVFGVVPFAESVTGFGIGVTVGVPLLRQLGHSVKRAALLSLLGLVAVPWGALGPGTLIAAELSGETLMDMGVRSALISLPVMLGSALAVVLVLRNEGAGWRSALPASLGSALLLWIGILGANLLLGTPPAGIVGSLLPVAAHLLLYRWWGSARPAGRGILAALVPYAVLTAGLLLARAATMPWEGTLTARAAASPGLWLLVACLAAQFGPGGRAGTEGAGRFRKSWKRGANTDSTFRTRAAAAARSWWPVGLVTFNFTVLGALLATTGMGAVLGAALAAVGPAYLAIGPAVNGLAGFIAGSNTAANSMLAATQAQAATVLGSSVLQLVAASNVTASMATMASPSRLLLAYELAVATPAAVATAVPGEAPASGAVPAPEAEHPTEGEVNRWILSRLVVLLASAFAVIGIATWWMG